MAEKRDRQIAADSLIVVVSDRTDSVSELAEQAGRDAGLLVFRAAQVEVARQRPEVRRAVRDLARLAGLGVAVLTAFVLGNWAAADALSTVLHGWRAPLVLAACWGVVGIVSAGLVLRDQRFLGRARRRKVSGGDEETQRQQAFEQAEQALHETLDRLSAAIAHTVEARVAAAVLPLAGGMVEAGEVMLDATEEIVETAEEITDALEERLPGGIVVNRAVDLALAPGRLGLRIARTVLDADRRGDPR